MSEKVIHEVRFIETDDGFRIEVKGDKERIRKMGFGHGMEHGMMGFGPAMKFRMKRRGHHRRHHGPGRGFSPWGWWWDDADDEPGDSAEPYEKPPQEA